MLYVISSINFRGVLVYCYGVATSCMLDQLLSQTSPVLVGLLNQRDLTFNQASKLLSTHISWSERCAFGCLYSHLTEP